MLDYIRISLYALLVVIGFLLFQAWEKEHPQAAQAAAAEAENLSAGHVPTIPRPAETAAAVPSGVTTTQPTNAPNLPPQVIGKLIKVKTDVIEVTLDTLGGDVVNVNLLKYPQSLHSNTPTELLNDNPKTRYIAESGLLGKVGPDTAESQAVYTSAQTDYSLNAGENNLQVQLVWQKDGIKVTKIFNFARDSYEVKVNYQIENQSTQAWQGSLYTQLMRTNTPPENTSGIMNLATYFGAAIATPDKPFDKITFKTIDEKSLNQEVQGGWAAMIQHYFISAWVPPKGAVSNYYTKKTADGLYTIGMIGQPLTVLPGAKTTV